MTQAEGRIREALMALVDKMPYEAISVQGICDEAGLSRKTFSRHFSSKEDVVSSQLRADIADPVRSILELLPMHDIAHSDRILLMRTYGAFYEHRDYYRKVVDALGPSWLFEQCIASSDTLGDLPYEANGLDAHEVSFVVALFGGMSATALRWWLADDFRTSPEDLVDLVVKWGYASFA